MTSIKTLALCVLAAATFAATPALADCKDCGTVAEVKAIKEDAANDPYTAAAVKGGARYQVVVNMDKGKPRSFTFMKAPDYKVGDKVKLVQGMKLTKQ